MLVIFEALFNTLPFLIAYRNISTYKFSIKEYVYMEISIVIAFCLLSLISLNLLSIAIYFLPIIFIYKKSSKLLLSVFLDIFICIVIVFTDSCLGLLVTKVFNMKINTTGFSYFIICLIMLIVLHLVSKLIGLIVNKYKDNILRNYTSKYAILIYISLIITFGFFYMNMNWNSSKDPNYLTKTNSIFFIGYSFVLLFVCMLLFFVIKKDETFRTKQIQFENLQKYTNTLEELYMDMRKFRHDYINILSSLGGFIEDDNMDALKGYFSNTIHPLNQKIENNNLKLGLLKNIKITELKGLVSSKLIRAQELGLNVNIDIIEPISYINMNIIDLIRSLGILLDNAIEAAILSNDKLITLGIIKKPSSIIIIVINSYSDDIPSISQLFKEGYSTKGKNRGLGLKNLREMISNNKNVLLDTSVDNGQFIQILTIKNK